MRRWLIVGLLVALAGCAGGPPEKLVGQDVTAVIKRLGTPREDVQATAPESWDGWFGPVPRELKEGTAYRSLVFTAGGEDYYVYAIKPADYQALRQAPPPADATWVVIMIDSYPEGAVF